MLGYYRQTLFMRAFYHSDTMLNISSPQMPLNISHFGSWRLHVRNLILISENKETVSDMTSYIQIVHHDLKPNKIV